MSKPTGRKTIWGSQTIISGGSSAIIDYLQEQINFLEFCPKNQNDDLDVSITMEAYEPKQDNSPT